MTEPKRVTVRTLPDGDPREGVEAGWTGCVLDIHLVDDPSTQGLAPGALVELEDDERLYLGVLQESGQSGISVAVEHALERRQIGWIRDVWG